MNKLWRGKSAAAFAAQTCRLQLTSPSPPSATSMACPPWSAGSPDYHAAASFSCPMRTKSVSALLDMFNFGCRGITIRRKWICALVLLPRLTSPVLDWAQRNWAGRAGCAGCATCIKRSVADGVLFFLPHTWQAFSTLPPFSYRSDVITERI